MPACALRYRLDCSGPAVYLVECNDQYHLYTRGVLGAAMPESLIQEMVANGRGGRWLPIADGGLTAPEDRGQATTASGDSNPWAEEPDRVGSRLDVDLQLAVNPSAHGEPIAPPA